MWINICVINKKDEECQTSFKKPIADLPKWASFFRSPSSKEWIAESTTEGDDTSDTEIVAVLEFLRLDCCSCLVLVQCYALCFDLNPLITRI